MSRALSEFGLNATEQTKVAKYTISPPEQRDEDNYIQPSSKLNAWWQIWILRIINLATLFIVTSVLFYLLWAYFNLQPCSNNQVDLLKDCADLNTNVNFQTITNFECNYCSSSETTLNYQLNVTNTQVNFEDFRQETGGGFNSIGALGDLEDNFDPFATSPNSNSIFMRQFELSELDLKAVTGFFNPGSSSEMRLSCAPATLLVPVDFKTENTTLEGFTLQIERYSDRALESELQVEGCVRYFSQYDLSPGFVSEGLEPCGTPASRYRAATVGSVTGIPYLVPYEYCCKFNIRYGNNLYFCGNDEFVSQIIVKNRLAVNFNGFQDIVRDGGVYYQGLNTVLARARQTNSGVRPGDPNGKIPFTDIEIPFLQRSKLQGMEFAMYARGDFEGVQSGEYFDVQFGIDNTGLVTPYNLTFAAVLSTFTPADKGFVSVIVTTILSGDYQQLQNLSWIAIIGLTACTLLLVLSFIFIIYLTNLLTKTLAKMVELGTVATRFATVMAAPSPQLIAFVSVIGCTLIIIAGIVVYGIVAVSNNTNPS